jgi:hypothetical protein
MARTGQPNEITYDSRSSGRCSATVAAASSQKSYYCRFKAWASAGVTSPHGYEQHRNVPKTLV